MARTIMYLMIEIYVSIGCVILLSSVVYAENLCNVKIDDSNKSAERTVFLTGGNSWNLFQKFESEAKVKVGRIDLMKLKVVISDGKESKAYKIEWTQMLTGSSHEEIWEKMLKNVKAEIDNDAFEEAERQHWDIVCYDKMLTKMSQPNTRKQPGTTPVSVVPDSAPLDAKQNLQQGMQYAARRDFENAIKEFTLAIQKFQHYATAYSNRGVAYMQQKKFDLAEDDLKKAVELGPKDPLNHYNLTCWYSMQNQVGRGLVSLDSALANGFNDYEALRKDPDLANLRKHPDWKKTLERHKVFMN